LKIGRKREVESSSENLDPLGGGKQKKTRKESKEQIKALKRKRRKNRGL
jgi:hypothetical protein